VELSEILDVLKIGYRLPQQDLEHIKDFSKAKSKIIFLTQSF
jgi:hypothetical protein